MIPTNEFEIPFLATPKPSDANMCFEKDIDQELGCLRDGLKKKARRKRKVLDVQKEIASPVIKNSLKDATVGLREADFTKQVH